MSKQSMREEAERLIRETMERKAIVVKQGNTRIEAVCGKCGAPNRVSAEKGASRVKFACKQCGPKQETLGEFFLPHCERREAIQAAPKKEWIASSLHFSQ